MYFDWKQMPLVRPRDLSDEERSAPVIVIGAGPVGLACALGLARRGVRSIVLEARRTISQGSRALAMNRRSMQILDALGIGEDVLAKGMRWSKGWTYYGKDQVHFMDLKPPAHEKHGQTNLQQCWMEQLLLDAIQEDGSAAIRYGHEVTGFREDAHGVAVDVRTEAGDYTLRGQYIVAADGPRGLSRRMTGLAYEGTSYSQRFVINDILCQHPLEPGRRLFFSPPYLPGKTVLMHLAPFGMWRLDFQLLDEQDAEEEMQPERVHRRIRAHLDLMGIAADYQLVLTSVYKANAVSLPAYRRGRVLFAGDAAHQVPIFGGRGVNHGYSDAHNLAWKIAAVLRHGAPEALLQTYSDERRGDILDTLRDLTKTTIFITTPSPGVALVREAVLSLSATEDFLSNLFDPYASPPYEYSETPLNATRAQDEDFAPRCRCGAVAPDVPLEEGGRLHEKLGPWLTVLRFGHAAAPLPAGRVPVKEIVLPTDSAAGRLYDARPGTVYLLRPDHRISGRWRHASAGVLAAALQRAAGFALPAGD